MVIFLASQRFCSIISYLLDLHIRLLLDSISITFEISVELEFWKTLKILVTFNTKTVSSFFWFYFTDFDLGEIIDLFIVQSVLDLPLRIGC